MNDESQRHARSIPSSEVAQREILKLTEALQLCQRELAQVYSAQEPLEEQCSQSQAQAAAATEVSKQLARALAQHLSHAFWEQQHPTVRISLRRFVISRWPGLGRFIPDGRGALAHTELPQIRAVEASGLFQAGWYLQHNADVALAGINPAVHYLQAGAQEGRDPGPEFSTRAYVDTHPEVVRGGINPLLHYLQSQQTNGG